MVSVSTSIGCPLCFILNLFVVHYVSSFYFHYYGYYSSSDCGDFWYVISIICDHGYLFDGASYNIGSAGCDSATTPDTKRLWRCLGHASVPQHQPPSLMSLQACANYTMGSPQVGFFFRVEPPTILCIICLVSVLVSAFYFQVPCWMPYPPLELNHWVCTIASLGVYPWQAYVQPGDGHWPTPSMHRVAAPSTTLSRKRLMLLHLLVPQLSHLYGGAYSFGGLAESHPIPSPSLHGR